MNTINYMDFYQKALVPIGENDLNCYKNETAFQANYSHWLIALVGELKNIDKEFYCWKVAIYPADSAGGFSFRSPIYSSTLFDCIHKAFEHATNVERASRNDLLHPTTLQTNVS